MITNPLHAGVALVRATGVTTADAPEAAATPHRPRSLRESMITRMRQVNALRTDRVAAAVRAVRRHLFAPEFPLE